MDLNRVVTFVHVVEQGSFTAAARILGLPTSSVSRAVAGLEKDLGIALLARTTRKLSLTGPGRLYYERVRPAVEELAAARDLATETSTEPRGIVRMTAAVDAGRLMAGALARFAVRYPNIHVDLMLTGRRVDLIEEGFDLAVRAGQLVDSSLIAKKIGETSLRLTAAPDYLARRGRPRRLTQLARHDCILLRGVNGRARWELAGPRGNETVEVRGPISADDLGFVYQAALEGAGIALLPELVCKSDLEAGHLEVVLPTYTGPTNGLYLVHVGRHVPRRVALLRDFLYDELGQLPLGSATGRS